MIHILMTDTLEQTLKDHGIQKLLKDMKQEKINCILVKDLSRLGRNYIEVGNYIEQIFPLFNIRFISINDNIDSFLNPASTNTILVPFKNLLNDEYCRDTSIKIKSSLNSKKKKGEFVGAFSAYGYIKDPQDKHKLIIDKQAAEIVKQIFKWHVEEGIGKVGICKKLNELGILNPTGHKKLELGQNYNNAQSSSYTWSPSTIGKILKNEIYIGNTIQGKRKVKSYKIHKLENVPEEEWIRVENTHEPIIDKKIFQKSQEINKKDVRSCKTGEMSKWAGILKCGDCKRAMNKKISTNKYNKKYEYYICSTYRKKSEKLCTSHKIQIIELEQDVLKEINNNYTKKISEIIEKINNKNIQEEKESTIKQTIKTKRKQLEKLLKIKLELYEDLKEKIITKEEYVKYKEKYELDIEKNKNNIIKLENELQKQNESTNIEKEWITEFKKNKKLKQIPREIITELIDNIYIYENKKIQIKWKSRRYLIRISPVSTQIKPKTQD